MLSDAVLEIAAEMETEATAERDSNLTAEQLLLAFRIFFRSYARSLRTAVKASEGTVIAGQSMTKEGQQLFPSPEAQHAFMIEQAKQEFRRARQRGEGQEEAEPIMRVVADGPCSGDSYPTSPSMPVGAKMEVAGLIYCLKPDNKLHHVRE